MNPLATVTDKIIMYSVGIGVVLNIVSILLLKLFTKKKSKNSKNKLLNYIHHPHSIIMSSIATAVFIGVSVFASIHYIKKKIDIQVILPETVYHR